MSLMVSISGIRGIVGSSLTPEVIVKYSSAFAEYCGRGTVVIGRDGRITGKPVTHIVSSTLISMGCNVIALGICPTPTVQIATERTRATGGISVTASHNPIIWNGLKFVDSSGLFLNAKQNKEFWNLADRGDRTYALWDKMGSHTADDTFIDRHIQSILDLPYINPRALIRREFKVVADCVNAAGGVIVPKLLRKLGCHVVEMNCDVSGIFAHAPEPVPENLTALCRRVKAEKADLGIAVDPDADRLVLIDETGHPFGEEYTIASVVRFVLEKESQLSGRKRSLRRPQVVVNLSTTRAVEDIAKQFGGETHRTAVGEINVAQKMKEVGALVGGEGSGGVILPSVHLGRDAAVGIALVIQQLAEFGGSLSALKRTLPQYSIIKGKIDVGRIDPDQALQRMKDRHARRGRINTTDGLRIDFPDSWVHLRKSNTEPIVRIIAEAPTKQEADQLAVRFTREIRNSR
ncbi:MAG: phosphoglucosamine mutase [Ignavibacteriales bacterium]|nr:phosphoglucosamine mutase [Ignavibacteriales bacterium]